MRELTLIILIFAMSCSSDNYTNNTETQLVGTWKLTEVVAGWTNKTTPASELSYQEFYNFKNDGTVEKYRSTGEKVHGEYTIEELSDGKYVKVSYDENNQALMESCTENEFLRMEANELKGGSLPCDGPGLTYGKVIKTD